MSSPLHKHEGPQWMTSWRRFCPSPQIRRAFGGSYPKYLCPPNFVVHRKIFFWNVW